VRFGCGAGASHTLMRGRPPKAKRSCFVGQTPRQRLVPPPALPRF
jgi:hypothetical protein